MKRFPHATEMTPHEWMIVTETWDARLVVANALRSSKRRTDEARAKSVEKRTLKGAEGNRGTLKHAEGKRRADEQVRATCVERKKKDAERQKRDARD